MVKKNMDARVENVERTLYELNCRVAQEEWRRGMDATMSAVLEQLKKLSKESPATTEMPERDDDEVSHGSGHNSEKEWKWRNLELPMFGGEDTAGWIGKIERYFRLKGVTEKEKIEVAIVPLEGNMLR